MGRSVLWVHRDSGAAGPQYAMEAREAEAFFEASPQATPTPAPDPLSGKPSALKRLEGSKGVLVVTPDQTLEAESGVYEAASGTITLKGHVKATQGENFVEGASALISLKEGSVQVFPGVLPTRQRVQARIVIGDLQKAGVFATPVSGHLSPHKGMKPS